MKKETIYILDECVKKLDTTIADSIKDFSENISTVEKEKVLPFLVFQDSKSKAHYIECHINSDIALPLIDLSPALDIEEQADYKANRDLRMLHKAFLQMQKDAKEGRQFSDLIVEYNTEYRSEKPLKLLGGQHRVKSIELAYNEKKLIRPHGFRVYFGLSMGQRAEIAEISNTNIQISLDLIDRMAETKLGPQLRNFCQEAGLLKKGQDFADRKNPEGIITVRLARSFLVNFFKGIAFKNGGDINDLVFDPYLCKTGGLDSEYEKLTKNEKNLWNSNQVLGAGKKFAELHKKQIQAIENSAELRKFNEFRNKAISAAVISSWSLVAGILQRQTERLNKFYSLAKESRKDPLNAKAMSEARHEKTDPDTYRGLGTRSDKKDKGRLVQLFLLYSDTKINKSKIIDDKLLDVAIEKFEANRANEAYQKKLKKMR